MSGTNNGGRSAPELTTIDGNESGDIPKENTESFTPTTYIQVKKE